jgi:endonuclease YncB( thermonuclease family)
MGVLGASKIGLGVACAIFVRTIILPNESQAFDAPDEFPGPVRAHVARVIDGDTFEALADIWLDQQVVIRVRIAGMDAPELRARCDAERSRAEAARDYLTRRIEGGEVRLSAVHFDKYGGRVDAEVIDARGRIADAMIRARLARAYDGGHRDGWC